MDDRTESCHWLLLRLAGHLPDDLLTRCRAWLAEENFDDLARALVHIGIAARLDFTVAEFDLLDELFELIEAPPAMLVLLSTVEQPRPPLVEFAPTRDEALASVATLVAGGRPPMSTAEDEPDEVDQVVVSGTRRFGGAVWRTWRYASDGSPWPPLRRVYVVEVGDGLDLPAVTAELQRVLAGTGDPAPQVEVYPIGADLPSYQFSARGNGVLLWSSTPVVPPRIAPAEPGETTIADPERGSVLRYLYGGEPLLINPEPVADVVDPSRGEVVPTSFRTDGQWIWNDASAYYLERHGRSPDPGLVEHIRSGGYAIPRVDGASLHRADRALQQFLAGRS